MESMSPANAEPGAVSPPVENRAAARIAAALVPTITGLRLSPYGTGATLVNISATGLLAECGIRLKPGSAVTLMFEGTFAPPSVPARVVRCAVAAMGNSGGLVYHVGVAFDAPIALGAAPAVPKAAPKTATKTATHAATPAATLAVPKTEAEPPMPEPTPVRGVVRNRW